MEMNEIEFQIITWEETIGGDWAEWKVWERYNESKENEELIFFEHTHLLTVEDVLQDIFPHFLIWWCVFSSLIYFVIFLIYYIFYKLKRTQTPLKFAFKKSILWWVVLLLLPLLVVVGMVLWLLIVYFIFVFM